MGDGDGRDESGFLGRWSRRKHAEHQSAAGRPGRGGAKPVESAGAGPLLQMPPAAADAEARLPATADQDQSDDKVPADLPAVDRLDKDSDYTQFLRKGVPEALKRQALKRLWASDPQFDVVDPFTEYGGDYTVVVPFDALNGTLYKPGLGYLTDEELEQQKNLRKEEDVASDGDTAGESADAATPPAAAAEADAAYKAASGDADGDLAADYRNSDGGETDADKVKGDEKNQDEDISDSRKH